MVSVEVRNSTTNSAAYETTSTAHLARQESSAGFLNPKEDYDYKRPYDNVDPVTGNYNEGTSTPWYKKRKETRKYKESWGSVVETQGTYDDNGFDTGEIEAIRETAEKINSGELYANDQMMAELGERALALIPLVDVELPVAPVENALLRVVAVNPDFEEKAVAAVDKIYSNRPGMTAVMKKVIKDTVHKTAQVASNPDDYINLNQIDGTAPTVDRIVEEASNFVTSRRINQSVQEKEWAEEDRLAAEEAKSKVA